MSRANSDDREQNNRILFQNQIIPANRGGLTDWTTRSTQTCCVHGRGHGSRRRHAYLRLDHRVPRCPATKITKPATRRWCTSTSSASKLNTARRQRRQLRSSIRAASNRDGRESSVPLVTGLKRTDRSRVDGIEPARAAAACTGSVPRVRTSSSPSRGRGNSARGISSAVQQQPGISKVELKAVRVT